MGTCGSVPEVKADLNGMCLATNAELPVLNIVA